MPYSRLNPYDQPTVELAKQATSALKRKPGDYRPDYTYKECAKEIRSKTDVDKTFLA